jgi:hypothetical protein
MTFEEMNLAVIEKFKRAQVFATREGYEAGYPTFEKTVEWDQEKLQTTIREGVILLGKNIALKRDVSQHEIGSVPPWHNDTTDWWRDQNDVRKRFIAMHRWVRRPYMQEELGAAFLTAFPNFFVNNDDVHDRKFGTIFIKEDPALCEWKDIRHDELDQEFADPFNPIEFYNDVGLWFRSIHRWGTHHFSRSAEPLFSALATLETDHDSSAKGIRVFGATCLRKGAADFKDEVTYSSIR